MFHFATPNRIFHYTGLALMCLLLSLFVFGEPPLQSGIWIQTEPALAALFALTALVCIWLAAGVARGWLEMQKPHPILLTLMVWVGWQIFVSSIAVSQWRSWFGPPESGEGTGWYVSMLAVVALAYPLWQVNNYRRILIAVAAANIGVMAAMQDTLEVWRPEIWADFLAFMIGAFWIFVIAGDRIVTRRLFAALIMFTVAVVVTSHSKSAIPLLLLSVLAVCKSEWPLLMHNRPRALPSPWARKMLMALCLLPVAWIVFSPPASTPEVNNHLGARLLFNRVAMSTMMHEPVRWFGGAGWGRFDDDIFKYALVDGVSVYKNGERNPNWDGVDGHAFHSHSEPLEVLLSLGLPGLVLWFALPLLMIKFVPGDYFWRIAPMVVGLTALSFFWFQLSVCMPYQALEIVAVIALCVPTRQENMAPAPSGLVALFLWGAFAFAVSFWQQWEAEDYGGRLYETERTNAPTGHSVAELDEDIKRGGERLRASAVNYGLWVAGRVEQQVDGVTEQGWLDLFLQASRDAAKNPKVGVYASSSQLMLQYMLLMGLDKKEFDTLRHEATLGIEDSVMNMTRRAPLREDMTALFLSNLDGFTHGDVDKQAEILQHILKIAPNHRAALWLLGQIYIKSSDTAKADEGTRMMKRAVELGVERVYPVTDAELAAFK